MALTFRPIEASDLPALHRINQTATPGVGEVSEAELAHLVQIGALTLVAEDAGRPLGFILCMLEGLDYASPNYRWIAARYPTFAYCDRIAVAESTRGRALGRALYERAFAHFSALREVILCEVNLAPPNPGSLRFHERLGFRAVGERWSEDRSKGVVFLEKRLR
jgi:predicted GNAT superfamily acetyltransferase